MTIIETSYIKQSGQYYLNANDFDSRILFTDTNTSINYVVIKYDTIDSVYKVIVNGILQGYSNNTDYNYRFDFDKYINIENIRKPVFTQAGSSESNQNYSSTNYSKLTFGLTTGEFLVENSSFLIMKDNGEIWLDGWEPSDLTYSIGYYDYLFLDKEDNKGVIMSSTPVIYSETWIPMTIYGDIVSSNEYKRIDSVGRNYLNDSACPLLSPTDIGFGNFEKIQTEEDDFYQVTPDLNKIVSIYKGGIVMDGSHYINSVWVRHTNGAAMTVQIYNDMNPGTSSKITTVQPNVWTLISTNYFWGESYGNIIIATGIQNVYLDYKFLKVEKGHTTTNWTPSFDDYNAMFITYNSTGLPINIYGFNRNNVIDNHLQYIDSDAKTYYFSSPYEHYFGNVISKPCNTRQLFYNGINGNIDMLYTAGNEHEVNTITKDYITVGNQQFPIKLNTQKQYKLNTGFGLNQSQVYSLVKSPYVFKVEGGELEQVGRNLALNTSDFVNTNHWDSFGELPYGQISVITNENTKCLYFNRNNTVANSSYILTTQVLPNILKKNTNYTISFMYKNTGHIGNVYVYSPAFTNLLRTDLPISQAFKHFEWTFNTGPGVNMYLIRFDCIGAGLTSASELFLYDIKLEEGSFTSYTKALEDQNLLSPKLNKYKLNTSSFEGYIGSKLSEKNIELLIEDEKTYKRRSNINLDFWE